MNNLIPSLVSSETELLKGSKTGDEDEQEDELLDEI